MASIHTFFTIFSIALIVGLASSSPTSLSDNVFDSHGSNSRSLLQTKKGCNINFEAQNYTIITSQCKGPQYSPKSCCEAFKEFACPFSEEINDVQNDCATTMFSYINLYGKYPPGLFALQCREGKEGLECTDILAKKEKSRASSLTASPRTILAILVTAFFLLPNHHLFF